LFNFIYCANIFKQGVITHVLGEFSFTNTERRRHRQLSKNCWKSLIVTAIKRVSAMQQIQLKSDCVNDIGMS